MGVITDNGPGHDWSRPPGRVKFRDKSLILPGQDALFFLDASNVSVSVGSTEAILTDAFGRTAKFVRSSHRWDYSGGTLSAHEPLISSGLFYVEGEHTYYTLPDPPSDTTITVDPYNKYLVVYVEGSGQVDITDVSASIDGAKSKLTATQGNPAYIKAGQTGDVQLSVTGTITAWGAVQLGGNLGVQYRPFIYGASGSVVSEKIDLIQYSPNFGGGAMTFCAELTSPYIYLGGEGSYETVIHIQDGSGINGSPFIIFRIYPSFPNLQLWTRSASGTYKTTTLTSYDVGNVIKCAFVVKSNTEIDLYADGTFVSTMVNADFVQTLQNMTTFAVKPTSGTIRLKKMGIFDFAMSSWSEIASNMGW